MIAFLHDLLGVFAAIAPFGAFPVFLAYRRRDELPDARLLTAAPIVAFALLAAAALVSDPFLDVIDVTPENFQLAAGVLMLPLAARLILTGASMPSPRDLAEIAKRPWLFPLAVPLLAGPSSVFAAVSYAARFGELRTVAATAIVLTVTATLILFAPHLEPRLRERGVLLLGHISGLLLLAVAFENAIDGIRSV